MDELPPDDREENPFGALLLFGIQDAALMAKNMAVAAESLGLGGCFLGAAPYNWAERFSVDGWGIFLAREREELWPAWCGDPERQGAAGDLHRRGRFYASQGCTLGAIHRLGYAGCPDVADEAMLL